MRLTAQELEQMKRVDIGAVSPESLPDVSGMTFDNTLSRKEHVTRFLQIAKNLCLHHDMGGDLAAADDGNQMLEIGYLLVGELIQQAGDMLFERAAVLQGLITQDIEHLRIDHGRDKIKRGVHVGHHAEQGHFPVPQLIQFQLVPFHQLPDLLNIKGGAIRAPQEIRMDFAVLPETSCQGLFNQIHEKVTNERLFFARTSLLFPAHGI